MKFSSRIGYALLRAVMWPISHLPLCWHRAVGRGLGRLVGKFYRRDVVEDNIARAFPDRDGEWVKRTGDRFYLHFGQIFGEAIWFGGCTDPARLKKADVCVIDNPELLNGYVNSGRSVMILMSHSGNWELIGGFVNYSPALKVVENDIVVGYMRQGSEVWNEFFKANRTAPVVDKEHADGMVETFSLLRYAVRNRDKVKTYIFITDQRPYIANSSGNAVVEFMGRKVYGMTGGAALASKFGMPVLYLSMLPGDDGRYHIRFDKICDNASGESPADITRKYFSLLEEDIRKVPWNYLWTHKRWKITL